MVREIQAHILTPRRLIAVEDGREVLDLVRQFSSLVPEKWGTHEPICRSFKPADYGTVLDAWGNVFLWKRKHPKTEGMVFSAPAWSKRDKSGSIYVTIEAANADMEGLVEFVTESASRFTAHFAYVHLLTEKDIPIGRLNKTVGCLDPQRQRYSLGVTGHHLDRYVPDLYWVTIFGEPYVKLFGSERLLSAPAPVVREIGGGCIYIQLSDSIYDLEIDYESVDTTKQAVKKHLDRNAFFDPNEPESHVYNIPELGLEPLG